MERKSLILSVENKIINHKGASIDNCVNSSFLISRKIYHIKRLIYFEDKPLIMRHVKIGIKLIIEHKIVFFFFWRNCTNPPNKLTCFLQTPSKFQRSKTLTLMYQSLIYFYFPHSIRIFCEILTDKC